MDLHFCLRSWIFGDFWEEKEEDSFVLHNHESGSFIGVLSKDDYNYWGNKNGRLSEQGSQKGEVSQASRRDICESRFNLLCTKTRHGKEVEKVWTLVSDWLRLKLQLSQSFVCGVNYLISEPWFNKGWFHFLLSSCTYLIPWM